MWKKTLKDYDVRVSVLGHMQRGGARLLVLTEF